MWILYQIAVLLISLAVAPFLLLARGSHYRSTLRPRLGLYGNGQGTAGSPLWIHAVSVGEVGVAATLAEQLAELAGPGGLLVTTVTPTGQEQAKKAFPGAQRTYLPFEIGFAVRRFFSRYRPRALVLAEGDLWPLVLRRCRRQGLPVVVVNGRVSDRSFSRMKRLRRFLGPILTPVGHFAVQTADDRNRLETLGVEPARITVTGNLKFESPEPVELKDLARELRQLAAERPILVAGSTMRGEEEKVLEAFANACSATPALLVLAPRHPERWDRVGELLTSRGLRWVRRSELPGDTAANVQPPNVVLLDSMGELASVYRLAASAFVGGTLVPSGGHNPLEAARFGVPVVLGPSMENFREIEEAFDLAGAWTRVEDAASLATEWKQILADPAAGEALGQRGLDLLERHRGAAHRTGEILRRYLGSDALGSDPLGSDPLGSDSERSREATA